MLSKIEPVRKGDIIAIIAPAGKIDYAEIQIALKLFEEWGLKVWVGKNIKKRHSVFAGTDKERASDLQYALDSDTIKAIVCARGGYGTIRTLDYIDWTNFTKHPKMICGFSDITVIHSLLSNHSIPSLHSLMPINFKKAPSIAIEMFRKSIFGEDIRYEFENNALNRKGSAKGTLTGGNVSILLALRGTELEPNFEGKILFLEDVAETHYHLDRMMQNFKRSIFPHISGLIVGQFSEMKDGTTSFGKNAFEIVQEASDQFDFPVVFDFPGGHIPDNRSLWMNRECILEVSDKAKISYNELTQ